MYIYFSETTKFYKALAMIGIDFFMINKLFPKRTRDEIKVYIVHTYSKIERRIVFENHVHHS